MADVIIFEGYKEKVSPVEEMLNRVRTAALKDNLAKLLSLDGVGRVVLSTNRPELKRLENGRITVRVNALSPDRFHFGRELQKIISEIGADTVLCMGGAAVPLIHRDELAAALRPVTEKERRYVTNNVQSADIIAFSSASVLESFPPPATDNALVLLLRYDAGFEQRLMPASLGTQFDIDTPSDLLVLADSPFGGPALRAELDSLALDTTQVNRLKAVLRGNYPELALMGRIGAPAIARLNNHLKVRLRVFSEERGMKALGRLERNEVVSLLGYWLEEIGPDYFFGYLARTVNAALIDTRVLFGHFKLDLSDADRFYSDLGEYHKIENPFVREFTRAAAGCGIPVLLGGHSLVTGSVWAFTEEIGCLI